MSEKITKLKYKKNGIVETIYPVTHVDAIVGNIMLSKVVNVVASTGQTNLWGNPIRYKVPQTSSGNTSIVMLINAENTSSAGSEKYLGIMEMNILATGSNQTNGSNLNWLVVHGFEKENFHLRHLKSADEILLWVKPTVENLTITILSETTNGEATNNAILIDKPALTTVTSTTIVGNKLSDSQFLELNNTISGSKVTGKLADGVEAFTQSVGDNSDKVATTKYVDQSTPKIKTLHSKSLLGSGNVTLNASDVGARPAGNVPWTEVSGKPSFHIVATSGNYNNLLNKPYIPNISTDNVTKFNNLISGSYNLPYKGSIIVYGDSDKYYPVHFAKGDQNLLRTIKIWRTYSEQAPNDWNTSTHKGSLNLEWKGNYGAWGGAVYNQWIYENTSQYTTLLAGTQLVDNSYAMAFFLRGGGTTGALYHFASDQPLTWTDSNLTYTKPTAFYNQEKTFEHSNSSYEKFASAPRTTVDVNQLNSITVVKGKPTYTASEVGAAPSSHTHGKITNAGTMTATVGSSATHIAMFTANPASTAREIGAITPANLKTVLGLDKVDNTSDADKPISTATQTALNGKEPAFSKNTAFNKNFGTTAGTVTQGNDSRLSNARASNDVLSWAKIGNSDTIPTSKLPALAITDTFEVASQSAMTNLTAQKGDIAIRTDLNKTFILAAEPASTVGNWKELKTPTDAVLSVAGLTGAITSSNLKTSLSLNNVENKSSATIRSEITSANVTSALGFTPYNSTNPNGYSTTSYVDGKIYLKSNTDNRSVNTAPNDYNSKFEIKGLKSNSTLGITGQGSYSALLGIRGWSDSSGGNSHEFALTGNGEIYHRHGATTSWNAWDVLVKQSHLDKVLKEGSWNSSTKTLVLEVI